MAALLTTDTAAALCHILVNILVAHSGLGITDSLLIEGLVEAKVGHDRSDNRIIHQLTVLFHVAAVDVQDMVTGDDIALFIYTQAAVCIAVKGKSDI